MEFHKITMVGKYILQLLSSNPSENEKGRLWFNDTDDRVVVGTGDDEKNLAYEEDLEELDLEWDVDLSHLATKEELNDHIDTTAFSDPRAHGATSGLSTESIMARDDTGRCSVEHPGIYEYHIATKGYVDDSVDSLYAYIGGYDMSRVQLFTGFEDAGAGHTGWLTIVDIDWTHGGILLSGNVGGDYNNYYIEVDGTEYSFGKMGGSLIATTLPSNIKFNNTLRIRMNNLTSPSPDDMWGAVWVYENES